MLVHFNKQCVVFAWVMQITVATAIHKSHRETQKDETILAQGQHFNIHTSTSILHDKEMEVKARIVEVILRRKLITISAFR